MVVFGNVRNMSAASDGDSVIKFLRIDFLDDMFIKIWTRSCEPTNLTKDPHKMELNIPDTHLRQRLQTCWRAPFPCSVEVTFLSVVIRHLHR